MEQKEDEISLIDLIAVIIKYKFLIIAIVILGAVVSILYFNVFQKQFKSIDYSKIEYKISTTLFWKTNAIEINKNNFANIYAIDKDDNYVKHLSYLSIKIINSDDFYETLIKEFDFNLPETKVNTQKEILSKKISASFDPDTNIITIDFSYVGLDFTQKVMDFIVSYIENKITEFELSINKKYISSLEERIATSKNKIINMQKEIKNDENVIGKLDFDVEQQVYKTLKTESELSKIESMPTIVKLYTSSIAPSNDLSFSPVSIIIVIFASLFLAIFIAFLLNAIENIKNDPVAMEKLKRK